MKHHLLLLTLGGGFGAMGNYLLSHLTQGILGQHFKHDILLVNLVGAIIVALLSLLLIVYVSHGLRLRSIILVATLGIIATITCLSVQTLPMTKSRNLFSYILHYGLKTLSCLGAICFGALIAENLDSIG